MISEYLIALRGVYIWLMKHKYVDVTPFMDYEIKPLIYGTPYFLNIDERNYLTTYDFKDRTDLAIQRDIFIFQCMVGCRVGDLMKFEPSNVSAGFLEYIQSKRKGNEKPRTIRVPLAPVAIEIVNRYAGSKTLLPCIKLDDYNGAIKEIFTIAELTRSITILDKVTQRDIQKPLNEIASSHLARRTLIGNLYSKVQDPNIVGSISGHVEGSKAFARYRTIDDEIKTNVMNLIQ